MSMDDHPWKITSYDSVTSTMDVLRHDLDRPGAGLYRAVMAHAQKAGRGRRGRSWQGGEGNLFLSFSLPFSQERDRCFEVSFSCSLALYQTIRFFAPGVPILLKWPNDIFLLGRKLSGILVEGYVRQDCFFLLVGTGVNLRTAPDLRGQAQSTQSYKGIALSECLEPDLVPSPLAFTNQFLPYFNYYEAKREQDGFPYIRQEWLNRTVPKGTFLTVSSECASITAPFLDLDLQGRLVIGPSNEKARVFSTGDVMISHHQG